MLPPCGELRRWQSTPSAASATPLGATAVGVGGSRVRRFGGFCSAGLRGSLSIVINQKGSKTNAESAKFTNSRKEIRSRSVAGQHFISHFDSNPIPLRLRLRLRLRLQLES